MELILVSGLSGSGKSIALRQLEDCGFLCIDNLPIAFLASVMAHCAEKGYSQVAITVDARAERTFTDPWPQLKTLADQGVSIRRLFLTASQTCLLNRYSETRRQHPYQHLSLSERIEAERRALAPFQEGAHVIDTTDLRPKDLQTWIRDFVAQPNAIMTLTFESFAFKHGTPAHADLVFDARCLPNPYYDKALRPLTGLDKPVIDFLVQDPKVAQFIDTIEGFLNTWIPEYRKTNRHFLTVAIGCTGGQHRSVYVAHALTEKARQWGLPTLERHRHASRLLDERHQGRRDAHLV